MLAQSSGSGNVEVNSDIDVVKVPVCAYNWAEYRLQLEKYWWKMVSKGEVAD